MPATTKPKLHALQTPKSASFPSELPRSPIPGTPLSFVKGEPGIKTPITPPTAYTDFLRALSSPSMMSPAATLKSGKSSPTSNPSSEASSTTTSLSSGCSCAARQSPKFTVPPSPYAYPQSAPATGALRRLRIPQSPLSPCGDSPRSAHSIRSPYSSMRSPQDWDFIGKSRSFDVSHVSGNTTTRPVSVKQVVTRTVTYTPRMDLAPAPKGKKRRLDA
ncbi:MAG: hypothetical protein M1825_000178 [Sarcosagium campestre]|nr:MAG: hypothetical protein M1825_000178 [Sarcosagium campestre]